MHIYIYTYIHHIFFIHSSVDGHLGCFHTLTIINSAAKNIGMHVSFWITVFWSGDIFVWAEEWLDMKLLHKIHVFGSLERREALTTPGLPTYGNNRRG